MEALVNGDLSIAITGIDRGDEIGAIAGVVLVLKEGMAKAKQFAGDQALQHQLAATEKHAALADMADAIQAKTSAALRQVSFWTAAMTETADDMAALASRTSEFGPKCGECLGTGIGERADGGRGRRTTQRLDP